MNLTTKFDLGQTVYAVGHRQEEYTDPCAFCAATGKLGAANGLSIECPKCWGRGGKRAWRPMAWKVTGAYTVGQVRLEVTDSPGLLDEDLFDNYMSQEGREESYMLVETGVGTGSVWYAKDLFASNAEAEDACETRNAEAAPA